MPLKVREIQSSTEIETSKLRDWVEQLGVPGSGRHHYVASHGDTDIGFLELDLYPGWNHAIVYHLFVLPDHRRAGVGTCLLEHAERVATSSRYQQIRIEPKPLGDPALTKEALDHFYLDRGYHRLTPKLFVKELIAAPAEQ